MDVSVIGLAELALRAKTAMVRQDMSIAMVKQTLQMDQAVVQLLAQATGQAQTAPAAPAAVSSGHILDIIV